MLRRPNDRLQADLVDLSQNTRGRHKYGLVVQDVFTREIGGFETTSSSSSTRWPRDRLVDTGQAGRVAKSLMSDPAFVQLRDHLEGHSRSLITDFDWTRQVGVPLSQVIVWRGPSVDHRPYVGVRDEGVEDSLGLASMLRPLIEKLLKEVL